MINRSAIKKQTAETSLNLKGKSSKTSEEHKNVVNKHNLCKPVGLDSEKSIVSEKMRKERKKRGKEVKRWGKDAKLVS